MEIKNSPAPPPPAVLLCWPSMLIFFIAIISLIDKSSTSSGDSLPLRCFSERIRMLRGTLSSASLSCSNDPFEFNCRELKLNPGGAGVRGVPAPRNVGFFV